MLQVMLGILRNHCVPQMKTSRKSMEHRELRLSIVRMQHGLDVWVFMAELDVLT